MLEYPQLLFSFLQSIRCLSRKLHSTKLAVSVRPCRLNRSTALELTLRRRPGFSATPEEVQLLVKSYVESNMEALSKLAWDGLSKTVSTMRTTDELRWVNALELRTATEGVYLEEFGPKKEKVAAAKVKKVWLNALRAPESQSELRSTGGSICLFYLRWPSRADC